MVLHINPQVVVVTVERELSVMGAAGVVLPQLLQRAFLDQPAR